MCDVKIGDKLSNEIKEVYDLFELENDLKESIKVLDFNVDGDTQTVHIYGCENEGVSQITIPKKINGYFVSGIGLNAFTGCGKLETIEFPNTITKIRLDAFYNCTSLASLTIPKSVAEIGYFAFNYCNKFSEIVIPQKVKK